MRFTDMVKMVVHPYTVRADQLPPYVSDIDLLYNLLYHKAGVDGLFTDFPDKTVHFLGR
ncbi:glycerophosphoryl diester phosphodiesterase family protein [Candidatus Erwinia dacicola]|uniref:Glycerophosphoryl diester phosphodiesterase family protein n=1 Tax=Candidatus Erwinia dacicola TaxID=252393 RepID=A0A328TKF5_9GAMM|nr:glycerophosphoryl diester phosphodiesterase family protein [Candidatus Erwinia dacicola]